MKLLIVLLSALSLCRGVSVQSRDFNDEIFQFLSFTGELVGEQIDALKEEYLEDEDFKATLEWLMVHDFDKCFTRMGTIKEFNDVIEFVDNIGIDVRNFIKNLQEAAIGRRKKIVLAKQKTGSGYSGFLSDLHSILPHEQLHAMFEDKLANDPEFRAVVVALQSEEFQLLWDAVFAIEEFNENLDNLHGHGIDVRLLIDIGLQFFGFGDSS